MTVYGMPNELEKLLAYLAEQDESDTDTDQPCRHAWRFVATDGSGVFLTDSQTVASAEVELMIVYGSSLLSVATAVKQGR